MEQLTSLERISTTFTPIAEKPTHCHSVAPGILNNWDMMGCDFAVTGYVGKEMTDEQRVFVSFFNMLGEEPITHLRSVFLPLLTGNPIIWPSNCGNFYYLLCSKFAWKTGRYYSWKDCDSLLYRIYPEIKHGCPIQSWKPTFVKEFPDLKGWLPRISPSRRNEDSPLDFGLYREKDPVCGLFRFDQETETFNKISEFGGPWEDKTDEETWWDTYLGHGVAIQPTFRYFDTHGFAAYMRSVSSTQPNLWITNSSDGGRTWGSVVPAPNHPNNNTSLCWVQELNGMLWNYSERTRKNQVVEGSSRYKMYLSGDKTVLDLVPDTLNRQKIPFPNCSYPNYCIIEDIDGIERIVIVFTYNHRTTLLIYYLEDLKKIVV